MPEHGHREGRQPALAAAEVRRVRRADCDSHRAARRAAACERCGAARCAPGRVVLEGDVRQGGKVPTVEVGGLQAGQGWVGPQPLGAPEGL